MEDILPIYEEHKSLNIPEGNFPIWRYMDIPSFLYLLTNNSLAFIRSDILEDKHEGTFPSLTSFLIDKWADEQIENGRLHPMYKNFSSASLIDKKNVYINCWCKEQHQMVHMWKIYSKENGVAIETDYTRLKDSILSSENVFPTNIDYIDFSKDHLEKKDWLGNVLTTFTVKRIEYKAESELRLIISHPRIIEDQMSHIKTHSEKNPVSRQLYSKTDVIDCDIDIKKLISKIYLSPFAPKWYDSFLKNVLGKYDLHDVKIIKSDL